MGLMGLILNIPLTIIGIKILGPRFGIKTILGFFLSAGFIDLLTMLWGNRPLVEGDTLLSCIFGAVLIGFGLGLRIVGGTATRNERPSLVFTTLAVECNERRALRAHLGTGKCSPIWLLAHACRIRANPYSSASPRDHSSDCADERRPRRRWLPV